MKFELNKWLLTTNKEPSEAFKTNRTLTQETVETLACKTVLTSKDRAKAGTWPEANP